jgi:hypothetical protein
MLPNGSCPSTLELSFVQYSSASSCCSCARVESISIAVIGFSLKFPEEAITCNAFWQMLIEGKSARTEIPRERFNNVAFGHHQSNGENREVR